MTDEKLKLKSKDSQYCSTLADRSLITISGPDRFDFLQGLITNDVEKCKGGKAIWSALLTAQGKFLYDFFVFEREDQLVIDCYQDDLMPLGQLLRKYKLRSDISMGIDSENTVAIIWPEELENLISIENINIEENSNVIIFEDPRHDQLGYRIVGNPNTLENLCDTCGFVMRNISYHENLRVILGIPDGRKDIEHSKGLLREYGFDELGGIDWNKGCYMGQELTARTKYRALIKKRLLPISGDDWPENIQKGDKILSGEKEIGEVRTVGNNTALAFIKLDRWHDALAAKVQPKVLGCDVFVKIPDWLIIDGDYDLSQSQLK